jgi:hypothetical protein
MPLSEVKSARSGPWHLAFPRWGDLGSPDVGVLLHTGELLAGLVQSAPGQGSTGAIGHSYRRTHWQSSISSRPTVRVPRALAIAFGNPRHRLVLSTVDAL